VRGTVSMVEEDFYRRPDDGRGRHIPVEDLIVRSDQEIPAKQRLTSYLCPCTRCHGGQRKTLKTIEIHREKYGRDEHLTFSILGGDPPGGFPLDGIWVDDNRYFDDNENVFDDAESGSLYSEEMDPYHDVQKHVRDAFGEGDRLREVTTEAEVHDTVEDVDAYEYSDRLDLLDELSRQASHPLYDGINVSIVSATIVLVNMTVVYSILNEYLSELLKYLSTALLSRENQLPRTYYEAKNIIRKLGLNYK
jgi:hypothetical protein